LKFDVLCVREIVGEDVQEAAGNGEKGPLVSFGNVSTKYISNLKI